MNVFRLKLDKQRKKQKLSPIKFEETSADVTIRTQHVISENKKEAKKKSKKDSNEPSAIDLLKSQYEQLLNQRNEIIAENQSVLGSDYFKIK